MKFAMHAFPVYVLSLNIHKVCLAILSIALVHQNSEGFFFFSFAYALSRTKISY